MSILLLSPHQSKKGLVMEETSEMQHCCGFVRQQSVLLTAWRAAAIISKVVVMV